MSWLLNLYETYEANISRVGAIEQRPNGQEYTLLPVSHTTQTAHIEVRVTPQGDFHSADVITDKNNAVTVIPATEKSSSRAGKVVAPYPLHDKLMYVAGDFAKYGGKIKTDENPYDVYIGQLKEWAESPYVINEVKSIYTYLQKGHLIKDLVKEKVLWTDEHDLLLSSWNKKDAKPPIFSVVTGGQESAFIRFTVHQPGVFNLDVWKNMDMYESFKQHYNAMLGDEDVCYVTGKLLPITERHANKIRNSADKAKLISANDTNGFTFRGRFKESGEVASISYEVSQKAHNALKWLINKQAKIIIDGRVFLVWGIDLEEIPDIAEDSSIFAADETADESESKTINENTMKYYAEQISKAISGYKAKLQPGDKVQILVLDSATTGRMAVLYYRSLDKAFYLDKLKEWHTSCVWWHRYRKNQVGKVQPFYGAPAPKDIAFAAYGANASDKIVKGLVERLIPCIVDGRQIPLDIIRNTINRASHPEGMENWEWEKTLSIACALINKKEGYSVALDKETNDRDYLFGRLLAIADVLERNALGDDKRATNARRYMNSFAQHPARTWTTIQSALQPYQARLGENVWYYNKLLDEVGSRIEMDNFNNRPLSGRYLLGFYSQRQDLYQKKDKQENIQEVQNKEEE
ncbi:type I-C CRISPR-associated protein Cas8c/Csd1 [Bacillus sp. HMF5848]|uniref:type I-C CRISPR-associated protein Cas8c/Csd1 n=1 Tax=Bacillus sp. HMF5848 TaxID=2495421 RepID=UPI000F7708A8|nr:type I-C CRISPR-associated protein Cas8c/Csd1 [Bacillus sp. HMF5848]RSK26545.1 type I-C CRISPR-associated protein Cas8c/Csd1 [Bacillus sp. HMF5848]